MVTIKFMDRAHNHGECRLEIPKEKMKTMTAGELTFLIAKLEQIDRPGILYINGVPVPSSEIIDKWDDIWINYGNQIDRISGYRHDSNGPFTMEEVEEMMKRLKVGGGMEISNVTPMKPPVRRRPLWEKMKQLEKENKFLKLKIYCLETDNKQLEKENKQLKQKFDPKSQQKEELSKESVVDEKDNAYQRSLDLAEQSLEKAEQKIHIYQQALLKSQDALQKAQQSALYLWNRLCSPDEMFDRLGEAVEKWNRDEDGWTKKAIKLWYRTKAKQMEEELKIIQKLSQMMAEKTENQEKSDD